ncbi:MAG TPA: hypothetical protein VLZ89_07100 [Anaerolineales bacterium]|nr:hypothetical protein [Anaerolineales bacterium]
MDIQSGFIAIAGILALSALISLWGGIHDIQSARRMTFFRLRRQRIAGGWRLLGLAVILAAFAVALPVFGEPVAYLYFPPSPTITLTPSLTPVPTITLTPSITPTPSITITPAQTATFTPTSTPFLPLPLLALFQSNVTPNPQAVFSPIQFTTSGNRYPAISPATVFQNPVGHMYAVFSYDKMAIGSQWTAIWLRDGQLVHYETLPWNCVGCGIGGAGFSEWNPAAYEWLPGNYEVQIFIGDEYKTNGRFIVRGAPPPSPTVTPTPAIPLAPASGGTPAPEGTP